MEDLHSSITRWTELANEFVAAASFEVIDDAVYRASDTVLAFFPEYPQILEAFELGCNSVGMTPEMTEHFASVVLPYVTAVRSVLVPLGGKIVDSTAALLEATPWWVLWIALLVSMPGPNVLDYLVRSCTTTDNKGSTEPARRGFGAFFACAVIAAAAVGFAAAPSLLQLTLPTQSTLLALALSAALLSLTLVLAGAVQLPWRRLRRAITMPVAAGLPAVLAWYFLQPKSYFCHARSHCREVLPEDLQLAQELLSRRLQLLASPHEKLVAAAAVVSEMKTKGLGAGSRAIVLTVGAHELKGHLTDYAALMALAPQMVFVEPNGKHLPGLNRSLAMIGASPKRTQIVNAAACVADKEDAVFFTSETAATRDSFEQLYMKRYSDMHKMNVRCMTVANVLKEARLIPKDIDMVILDAEGSDFNILGALLRLPSFAPLFIRFPCCFGWEYRGISAELKGILTALAARGYNIYMEGGNMLAVHESVD